MIIDFFSLNLHDPVVSSKFGGVYQGFFNALNELGCETILSKDIPSSQADVLVVPMGGGQEYRSLQAIRHFSGPVVLYVPPADNWFDKRLLNSIRGKLLLAYGTDISDFSKQKYTEIGLPYHCLAFASDSAIMRPLNLSRPSDVTFVGSLEHASRRLEFLEPLIKDLGKRPILCVGSGWEKYGIPDQLISWGPLLNVVYNLGNVCLNIHTEEQVQGINKQLDLNNRVFDLAMAGCCQVCDNSAAVRYYCDENEIVVADEPDVWVKSVLYLLEPHDEAEIYRRNALR